MTTESWVANVLEVETWWWSEGLQSYVPDLSSATRWSRSAGNHNGEAASSRRAP